MGDAGGNIFTGSRLTYIIVLSVILLSFNITEYVFAMGDETISAQKFLSGSDPLSQIGNTFMGAFTIQIPDTPYFVYVILSMINTIILVIASVITASYIYDGIQALGELIPF